jgi:hypothetical protein
MVGVERFGHSGSHFAECQFQARWGRRYRGLRPRLKTASDLCKMPAEIEYGGVAAPHEAIVQPIGRCEPIHAPAQELGAVGQWIH